MRISVFLLIASLLLIGQEIPEGWFAFPMDPRVAPEESLGSVAFLNPGPADQRITVKNGHFALPDGTPIRFFGSNVTFAKAFPDKDVAPLLAKRMRQLGFNVIRFHHIDNRHIWNQELTALDPAQLDKLQWFIHCLNQNGIYANINLHVSWWYKGLDRKRSSFKYGKSLDRYYPPFIEFQKWYAKELLTAVSPYSHLPMTDDPGIFCIEINNENAITDLANSERLKEIQGTPWGDYLLEKWRQWLAAKYKDAPSVVKAWQSKMAKYSPDNIVGEISPSFEGEKPGALEPTCKPNGEYEIHLLKDGALDWAYQMHFKPIELKETNYIATFEARCDHKRHINVGLGHAEPPWHNYSYEKIELNETWQSYKLRLNVSGIQNVKKRFSFNLRGKETPATIFLRNIELHEGDEPLSFANATAFGDIPLPDRFAPIGMMGDFRTLLHELDFEYTREMQRYLKETLKAKPLITDTQASYSGVLGMLREDTFSDFVDMHSYWQHPYFDPAHPWSPIHWTIKNTPMADSDNGGYFTRLNASRVAGKPYTVSEFDHPAPSEHLAEMFPMMGSYAAFQDWDALYQFCYNPTITANETPHFIGYFSMAQNPAKMVTAHFAALVFRLGLVPRAEKAVTISVNKEYLWETLLHNPLKTLAGLPGYPDLPLYPARVQTQFADGPAEPGKAITITPSNLPIGLPQETWSLDEAKRGLYLVKSPAARAAVGHLGLHPITLGDVAITVQLPAERTAAFTLVALDGKEIAQSKRMLLSLVGTVANVGMEWDEKHTTIQNHWGKPPAISNFIPAEITLPGADRPTITVLDPAGLPNGQLQPLGKSDAWSLRTLPEKPTLWFYISR